MTHDLAGRGVEEAELGDQAQLALLRHDQQLAVGVVEHPVDHRAVGQVQVRGHAGLGGHVAVAADRHQAVDEVGRLGGDLHRVPTQAVGRGRGGVERAALQPFLGVGRIGPVAGAGPQAVEPGAAVLVARGGEGRARQLLGVETERRRLRRVLADRQGAGHGLGAEVVAEAGLVVEVHERFRALGHHHRCHPGSLAEASGTQERLHRIAQSLGPGPTLRFGRDDKEGEFGRGPKPRP